MCWAGVSSVIEDALRQKRSYICDLLAWMSGRKLSCETYWATGLKAPLSKDGRFIRDLDSPYAVGRVWAWALIQPNPVVSINKE